MPGNPATAVWMFLGALAGLLAGHLLRQRMRVPVLAVTAGFVLAVLGRVEVETARDPSTHNLWPFEIIIAGGIGLAAANQLRGGNKTPGRVLTHPPGRKSWQG